LPIITATRVPKDVQIPQEILGMDVGARSLPDDIAGHATQLWTRGDQREALSIIYRGALIALIHRFACELGAADTEGDCLVKARAVLPQTAARYFSAITRAWQLAAYAHSLPNTAAFARLCDEYGPAFEVNSGAARSA
jgi:hypothetical protein